MKKIFANKKTTVIFSVILAAIILVSAIVVVSQRNDGPDVDVDVSTTLEGTPGTTGTAGDGTTTEEVTEESSETSDKTQKEDETKNNTETSTKKPETTTKKPNKTETTTKKPVTTTKPSSPDKVPEDVAKELEYNYYGGKEGYEAHLKEVANYKCSSCGKHDCPSLEYGKDLLGNPGWPSISPEKFPAIINGTSKCPHCGKTEVASSDDRWFTEPDKYCNGSCHLSFS